MPDRILIGNLNGEFVCRVSKPGKSVYSTDRRDFVFREDVEVMKPDYIHEVTLAPLASQTITLGFSLTGPPRVITKVASGRVHNVWGYVEIPNKLFIRNPTVYTADVTLFLYLNKL